MYIPTYLLFTFINYMQSFILRQSYSNLLHSHQSPSHPCLFRLVLLEHLLHPPRTDTYSLSLPLLKIIYICRDLVEKKPSFTIYLSSRYVCTY